MKVSVKVSGELKRRGGAAFGRQARLRTEGQLRRSLDRTADLSDVRAGVCVYVSEAWPGGGLKAGHV